MEKIYNKKRKLWTKEEQDTLLRIHTIYSSKELAEMFDTNPAAINCVKRKLGISYKQLSPKVPEGYKLCSGCNEILPLDDFYVKRRKIHVDGRQSLCKGCSSTKKALLRKTKKTSNKTI